MTYCERCELDDSMCVHGLERRRGSRVAASQPSNGGSPGGTVYLLPGTGARFHSQAECAGLTSAQSRKAGLTVLSVTREEAERAGRTPCQLPQCWG